jgi:hypothetical protein
LNLKFNINVNLSIEEIIMSNRTEAMANEAIFVLQFNTRDAVRYVQRNAGVDEATARQAISRTVTFHKQ